MSGESGEQLVGQVLGGTYEVTRVVGRGGMGGVYDAVNVRLGKHVAIKVLANLDVTDEKVAQRFKREARIATDLGHPHIIDVLDFNQTESGQPYMVMELLEGADLESTLKDGERMAPGRMAFIVRQVCSALHAAHGAGVIHRDLKPANVFLCNNKAFDDFVVVLDFGISKILGSDSLLTTEDRITGTPHYMAPEQAEGGDIGPTTDVFALGSIMYRLLTGNLPFASTSAPAILYRVVHSEPEPIASIRPDLPEALIAVVSRAMAKSQGERYPSVRELSVDLLRAVPEAAAPITDRSWEDEEEGQAAGAGPQVDAARETVVEAPAATAPGTKSPLDSTMSSAAAEVTGRPPSTRPTYLVAGVAVAIIAALTVVLVLRSSRDGVGPPGKTHAAPSPAPDQAPPPRRDTGLDVTGPQVPRRDATATVDVEQVKPARINVVGSPRGAQVVVAGRRLTVVPGSFRVPRSSKKLRIRVTHPGHVNRTWVVVPDRDRTVRVKLEPRPPRETDLPPNPHLVE